MRRWWIRVQMFYWCLRLFLHELEARFWFWRMQRRRKVTS